MLIKLVVSPSIGFFFKFSYTLEITLGGSTLPSRPQSHFNTGDYEAIGRHFCETLLDFSDPSSEKVFYCPIRYTLHYSGRKAQILYVILGTLAK